jgi:hypothetical protein
VYVFSGDFGYDILEDYDTTAGNNDIIRFADINNVDALAFTRSGNDLFITKRNTNNKVRINRYFSSAAYEIEQVKLSTGQALNKADIARLVK